MANILWLIPALPLLAAGLSALAPRGGRKVAASLAIGSMVLACFLSCAAFTQTLGDPSARFIHNFDWFPMGETTLKLGWMLDPLTAAMLVMITFVGTLIFIFSVGYMAHDENFTRFFCFLSLFAAAMLGLVIANSLLLLFMCWEVVGLASYLLIGFWFHKPSAAAAAKKAFITTRIGDVFFFLGLLWLYSETGTLLFYHDGAGCLEQSALAKLVGQSTVIGMGVSTAIALLIFCGAIGKSGQVPLHVWLPDAMEGPTPVSALIHAATMVAAGVFLVARVYPLMTAVPSLPSAISNSQSQISEVRPHPGPLPQEREKTAALVEGSKAVEPSSAPASSALKTKDGAEVGSNPIAQAQASVPPLPGGEGRGEGELSSHSAPSVSTALQAVTWIGAITALFAALVAVAQTDIKRILAYSTVSQLGFMFIGLGTGGVAVGMFHLLTHAFFKALLFLGAGSVIHGCHEEQDIRRMGGLRKFMPVTFVTYAIGMLALAGFPLIFCGYWSKDEILHAAVLWQPSKWPFLMGLAGAFLTAFYMTRQMWFVFFGTHRTEEGKHGVLESWSGGKTDGHSNTPSLHHSNPAPHESPHVMTVPLGVLAGCAILLSVFSTPIWPWFHSYLSGHPPHATGAIAVSTLVIMLVSAVIALGGICLGWWLYSLHALQGTEEADPLESLQPTFYGWLRGKFFIDELYEMSVIAWNASCARFCRWLDEKVWDNAVHAVSLLTLGVSWLSRLIDEFVVNLGFDQSCSGVTFGARMFSLWQNGQVQRYLRVVALALVVLVLLLIWGCK